MSNTRTGLMYSELTSKVYWGAVNNKTGIARSGKKDVTSEFIQVMLQKFPVNFSQEIVANGEHKATVIVLDKEKSHKYLAATEMYEENENQIAFLRKFIEIFPVNSREAMDVSDRIDAILSVQAKARGEHV